MVADVPPPKSTVKSLHKAIGGVWSTTEMSCVQVDTFPQSSTAENVRVIVIAGWQLPGTTTSLNVTVGIASQLSDTIGLPVLLGKVLVVH